MWEGEHTFKHVPQIADARCGLLLAEVEEEWNVRSTYHGIWGTN